MNRERDFVGKAQADYTHDPAIALQRQKTSYPAWIDLL